ncbi:hypothetical protein TNCT_530761 [Trichonephila clavata]|uniref:Uncharacterized protein n=1 Tax=Trichonephila clavata TaxID=2740835 RepID=A0A8X6KSL4_TRICU|nr:hypothetical protein TNCT_530761 [Trichonephila clavata]
MWFQLALCSDAPVLGILIGTDNLLYFRILDIASLLGKKNGTMFATCFPNDIIFGNNVLPHTQKYPKQTARVQLVTRNAAIHIIRCKNIKLAEKLSNALDNGYAYVQVAQWIREFKQDLELQRKRDFELLRQYIFSVTLESLIYNIVDAGNNVVNNDGIMEEDNNVENTIEEGGLSNVENTIEEVGVNNAENAMEEGGVNNVENTIEEGGVNNSGENDSMEEGRVNNSGKNDSMEEGGVNNVENIMDEGGLNNSGENDSMEEGGVNNSGENEETMEENRNDGVESLFQMVTESAFKSYINNNQDGFEKFTKIPHTFHFTRTLNPRIMIVVPDK